LKLLLVGGLEPLEIIATTFTRRAAAVLRSRIIEWGEGIRARILKSDVPLDQRVERLDFNQLRVGTIDSIAQLDPSAGKFRNDSEKFSW
jgi:DNA helicase-2/ATP-dependent DNA helicase PcrA